MFRSFLIIIFITNAFADSCKYDNGHIYCHELTLKAGDEISTDKPAVPVDEDKKLTLHLVKCNGEIDETSLENLRHITSLIIENCNFDKFILPELPELNYVNLNQSTLPEIVGDTFKNTRNIERMDISSNPGLRFALREFRYSSKIARMRIYNQSVPGLVKPYMDGLSGLTHLSFTHSHLKTFAEDTFEEYSTAIENFIFDYNDIEKIEPNTFAPLKNLRYLSLLGNKLESFSAELLKEQKKLIHLALPIKALNDIDIDILLKYCPKLEVVEILDSDSSSPDTDKIKDKILGKGIVWCTQFENKGIIKNYKCTKLDI